MEAFLDIRCGDSRGVDHGKTGPDLFDGGGIGLVSLGNLAGVVIAGLGLGAAENIAGFVLGAQFQLAFVFGLLVVVLVWRNQRLAAKRQYLK